MKRFAILMLALTMLLTSGCGLIKKNEKPAESKTSSEVESSEVDSSEDDTSQETAVFEHILDNVGYLIPTGSFDREETSENLVNRFYHPDWGNIYVGYRSGTFLDWHDDSFIESLVNDLSTDSNPREIFEPLKTVIGSKNALYFEYTQNIDGVTFYSAQLAFNTKNGYVIFIITSNSGKDDTLKHYNEFEESITIYDDSEPVNLKTTTTTTTTKATTATIAPPAFDIGEEIWIKGKVVDITGSTLTLQDYDGFNWNVNCSAVEEMSKLKNLVSGKYVKLTGTVTGNLKVDFVNIATGGKVYTAQHFHIPQPNVLYEDENVRISFAGVENEEYYSGNEGIVKFSVVNKRDFQVTIQCDSISLDGLQVDGYASMSDNVAPQSTAIVSAEYDNEITNTNPSKISGVLRIYDFSFKNLRAYSASFVNVPTYK